MGADSFSGQIEVADHVHDFMSDEFVGEPQTVVADDGAVMKDHRIIEASAFGEPRGDELREVTICDESPARSQFLLKVFRRDFQAVELCVKRRLAKCHGAGDFECVGRQDNH